MQQSAVLSFCREADIHPSNTPGIPQPALMKTMQDGDVLEGNSFKDNTHTTHERRLVNTPCSPGVELRLRIQSLSVLKQHFTTVYFTLQHHSSTFENHDLFIKRSEYTLEMFQGLNLVNFQFLLRTSLAARVMPCDL